MSELTVLFAQARSGDQEAIGKIFSSLYPELKTIARSRLRRGTRLTIMDTTALVHEAFLRFRKLGRVELSDRRHFLAYAARVIRTMIVDLVRAEQAEKRGGWAAHEVLDTADGEVVAQEEGNVLAVAHALESLEKVDPRLASVVEMRYFAGLSEREIADTLGVAGRTVRRDWDKARTFLMVALRS